MHAIRCCGRGRVCDPYWIWETIVMLVDVM